MYNSIMNELRSEGHIRSYRNGICSFETGSYLEKINAFCELNLNTVLDISTIEVVEEAHNTYIEIYGIDPIGQDHNTILDIYDFKENLKIFCEGL